MQPSATDNSHNGSPLVTINELPRMDAGRPYQGEAKDREIAARFAPIVYQGLGPSTRHDYVTNFDFDGDWRGDNNWNNSDDRRYPLLAYLYYTVNETQTHWYLHYAAYHPRDYKGGEHKGVFLSEIFREGAKLGGKFDPTGLANEAVLAHENDLEGCLVVVEKNGEDLSRAQVVAVETLAHNKFQTYVPEGGSGSGFETVKLDGQHPLLFAEPKGHGMHAYQSDGRQLKDSSNGVLKYTYSGHADDPEKRSGDSVGFDLLPICRTLWVHALGGVNETFGEIYNYDILTISVVKGNRTADRQTRVGMVGSAFLGKVGGQNMARPPWGWFSNGERDQPLGEWFFNPAKTVKRHLQRDDSFSVTYLHHPVLGVFR